MILKKMQTKMEKRLLHPRKKTVETKIKYLYMLYSAFTLKPAPIS